MGIWSKRYLQNLVCVSLKRFHQQSMMKCPRIKERISAGLKLTLQLGSYRKSFFLPRQKTGAYRKKS